MTHTLQAKVSPRLLQNAHLLFNQSPKTLLEELLQNARRAQAKTLQISTLALENSTQIQIEDDGIGIDTPENLLYLGATGWNETTQIQESPAGMGLFSLCHLPEGVKIHSKNWKIHLTPETFQGKTLCPILPTKPREGTSLQFVLPKPQHEINALLENLSQYLPILTFINGKKAPQEDFLTEALHIENFPQGRIGIFEKTYREDQNLNFQGKLLHKTNLLPKDWGHYQIKVDVYSNELIDLVLPNRNSVVENTKLESLKSLCRKSIYLYLTKTKTPHQLPYEAYQEAKTTGIDLPEAQPLLKPHFPRALHTSYQDWEQNLGKKFQPLKRDQAIPVTSSCLLSRISNAENAALHLSGGEFPVLFQPNPKMEGYSWYPKNTLESVEQILQWKTGKEIKLHPNNNLDTNQTKFLELNNELQKDLPDAIQLEIQYTESHQKKSFKIPTFFAFTTELEGEEAIEVGWTYQKGQIQEVGEDLLTTLFFQPYEDFEADSYETQLQNFQEMVKQKLLHCTHSKKTALKKTLEEKLNQWDIRSLLNELSKSSPQVILTQKDGKWIIKDKKK